ncbi:hypothetical protein CHS0354_008460 [Potamilus streckersoni]|uniref:RUN domain-containing protein n=1 Tax=Potamilus streckersoni TaxID=2493646 RepID=A0AAE0VGS1_9BIVA|nr:hypothetical protein CHS0354_008460 [Potamilus streckersoni]
MRYLNFLLGIWQGDTKTCEQGQIIIAAGMTNFKQNVINNDLTKNSENLNRIISSTTENPDSQSSSTHTTWKTLSSSSSTTAAAKLKKNDTREISSESSTSSSRNSEVMSGSEVSQNQMLTWKDVSPTKSSSNNRGSLHGYQYTVCSHQLETNIPTNYLVREDSSEKLINGLVCDATLNEGHEMSSDSNDGTGEGKHVQESSSPQHCRESSSDDSCNNDYFYDEDFIVQFDSNLRESSIATTEAFQSATLVEFPHMLTGSYMSFNSIKSSQDICQHENETVQYDSELSGSRNSAMEVSSSEREILCSSDMIEISDGPLFTPTPNDSHQILSTDSLDKNGVQKQGKDKDIYESNTSDVGNLTVDCCPRKEEYFLSFDGSNSRISCSETDCSVTSHDSGQGYWNHSEGSISSHDSRHGQGHSQHRDFQNICTSSEEGQENSDSFNFCYPMNKLNAYNQQSNQNMFRESNHHTRRLCTVKETLQEQQEKYDNDNELGSVGTLQQTSPSKRVIGGHSCPIGKPRPTSQTTQFCEIENTLTEKVKETGKNKSNRSDNVYLISFAKPSEVLKKYGKFSKRCKNNMVSWKQVQKLRKNCQIDGWIDPSDCCSLPDLSSQTWQGIAAMKSKTVPDLADSFHSKSHSASLLEFYQRLKSESTPVSPETLTNIEHILIPNFIGRRYLDVDGSDELTSSSSSFECPHCHHCQQPNVMDNITKGYTNKRIIDWLKMDRSAARPSSLGCQTTTQKECHTKETVISPQTVTMWCGTKHFGAQFPPVTKDCGIQTSDGSLFGMLNACSKQDKEMQTSDHSDEDLMCLLSEKYDDFDFLRLTPELKRPNFGTAVSCPEKLQEFQKANFKPFIHRSKSEDAKYKLDDLGGGNDNCTLRTGSQKMKHERNSNISKVSHSKSAGQLTGHCESPVRRLGISSYYTYKSLPDLEFLKAPSYGKQSILDENSSLFDPLQLPMPIPICIEPQAQIEDLDRLLETKKSPGNEHQLNSSPTSYPRVQPNFGRNSRHGPGTATAAAESASSSSGFSTSSTSSGIDPGSSDSRSLFNSSPQNDIERLIFFPPHTDVIKSVKKSNEPKKRPKSVPRFLDSEVSSGYKKLDRFACEMHPLANVICSKTHPSQTWHDGSPLITDQDDNTSEQLYSLEEENTPVPSPEKPSCCHETEHAVDNYRLGNKCNCNHACDFDYEFSPEIYSHEEDHKNAYIRHLSNDTSSSNGSFVPNYNKKPLKSCLRKQDRVLRSRSMSDPFSLAQEEQKQKEKAKNRHSYACDEVYIVADELGQLMMYQADDSAEPVLFYLDNNGECHMTEGGKQYECVPTDAADLGDSDGSSTERDSSSGKRKSVSFASEVSFHAISPQMSPRRQHTTGIQASFDGSQPTGEVDVSSHSSVDACQEEHQSPVKDSQMGVQKVKEEEELGDKTSQVEPHTVLRKFHLNEQLSSVLSEELQFKFGLFRNVSQAAEILVKHFAKSVDTFDKLRLGNTAECPEIGDIVLTKLCPAVSEIIADGMKSYLPGLHMFGRVQVTVWKIVEASLEIGADIRAVSELVFQLKQNTFLATQQQKFDAFIFGLLNLRLLDFWIGYIRQKDELLKKYYKEESLFQLASGCLKNGYESMIISLQPLSILPFQLSVEFMRDWHFKHKQNRPLVTGLNTTLEETKMDLASQKTSIDLSLCTNKPSIDNENATASILGSLGSPTNAGQANVLEKTAAKALNWLAKAALPLKKPINDDAFKTKSDCATTDLYQRHESYEKGRPQQIFVRQSKSLGELDSEMQDKSSNGLRSMSVPSAAGMAEEQTDPFCSLQRKSMRLNLEEESIPETDQLVTSPSGLLQKIASLGSSWTQKQAYRKGVTEYSFEAGALTEGKRPIDEVDTVQVQICGNEKNQIGRNIALKSHQNETIKLTQKSALNSDLTESPKKGAFDIINLFDKLLLPAKAEQEKARANSRWSWTANIKPGQDQGQLDVHLSQRCSQSDTTSQPDEVQGCTSKQSCSKTSLKGDVDSKESCDPHSSKQRAMQTRTRYPAPPPKPPRMNGKLDSTANGSKIVGQVYRT